MTDDPGRPDDRGHEGDERRPDGGKPSGSRPGGDEPSRGQSSRGQPYRGQPGGGRPDGGRRGGGKPYRGQPGGKPYSGKPYAGSPGGKPGGGKPYHGKPYGGKPGGKPYGGSPGGKPYSGKPGGKPYSSKPGGKPYGGSPGGKPYSGKPYRGRPDDHRRSSDRPAQASDTRGPGADGPPSDRLEGAAPGPARRVEYHQRDRRRGPRPPRGPWERDGGPRRGGPERRGRYAAPAPPRGPSPSEVLAEDEEVVAGRRPVEEAFAARREARRLLVVPERRAALDQLVLHATTLRIPVVEVEGGTITAVSGFDGHQGVALVVAPRRWATLDDVLALAVSRGEPPFVLALDHLEDPQNVGTLLRSAEACGVHGVMFPTKGAAPISPAAIKTSAGAVEHLLLVPVPDLAAGLVDLHARGLRVVGADGDARLTVREVDMRGPIVIVTGSEGRGLNARVRKRVDLMARIPMRGRVASLNASVAGSVFLFEAATQRDLPEAERPADGASDAVLPGAGTGELGETGREPAEAGPADVSRRPATVVAQPDAEPADDKPAGAGSEPTAAQNGPADVAAEPAPEDASEPVVDPDDLLPEAPPPPADESR